MKKAGLLLKTGFVAMAAIAFSSAAYSQGAEKNPGQHNGNAQVRPTQNTLKGSTVTAAESKLIMQKQNEVQPVVTNNPERNCTPKSALKPYSITRANFNNLPLDRQQFVLKNSDKYTIVD